jgi:hypothetical protein
VAEVADIGLRFLGAFGVTKINMRIFLLAFFLSCCLQSAVFSAEQPNIIVILADDLGYDDVSCYNSHSKIQTPHLGLQWTRQACLNAIRDAVRWNAPILMPS